ncbi:hypothetical protein PQQ75_04120 [Paraburkholderia aspalathi]|uniref:hypothetical protein n=1 Tax=Paraburkholderia aspalathi TaxID=1324617 RepID=UPI0038BD9F4C
MARTTSAAKTTTPAAANIALITEREGAFTFTTAASALHDAHVEAARFAGQMKAVSARAPAARVSRERFDADDALISFINANGWADLKTQKILDSVRAKGHACGMVRLNKLLGRDSKGNPLPVEAEKAE